jgi:hypothetical protein
MNRVMNMARTARAAGDSGICHVLLRGSPAKDIRRRRVMLTENRPLFILCRKAEQAEPHATCRPLPGGDQAVVTFDNRPDVEIALLIPYAQKQIQSGYLDDDLYTDLLFSIRRIAAFGVEQ